MKDLSKLRPILTAGPALFALPYSMRETTAHDLDDAVSALLREAEARARSLESGVRRLVSRLEDRETLTAGDIKACPAGAVAQGSAA